MTVLSRGARSRRGGRRPGWLLLTVLLVLAILASSALVFTSRVELLKLAVILALWAAVAAAFVSVIYRRQSDMDAAKARDLKLVYDLQLDREISARREYELTVESQLRRELASELRAQAADEVAALRLELAALRTNLEILFDADLSDRPAIEHDRSTARPVGDWPREVPGTGRVTASRLDAQDRENQNLRTQESPIIDVSAEEPSEGEWTEAAAFGGAHRLPSDSGVWPAPHARRHQPEEPRPRPAPEPPPRPAPDPTPPQQRRFPVEQPPAPPRPIPQPTPPPPTPPRAAPPQPAPVSEDVPGRRRRPEPDKQPEPAAGWQPAPAEGLWLPPGSPGSNWVAPATENGAPSPEYVGRRRAPEMSAPPSEPPRGRHSASAEFGGPGGAPPTLAAPAPPPPAPEPEQAAPPPEAPPEPPSRHRGADDTGGQSVADLLARFQVSGSGGGRRRRRED